MKQPHNILAIETATSRGSIALSTGRGNMQEVCIGECFEHSRTLAGCVQRLLSERGLRPRDVHLICVSKGPGSFTGLRVGIAFAKGVAMGLGIPVVGISTFEVLLAGFLRYSPKPNYSFPPQFPSPLTEEGEVGVKVKRKDISRIAILIDAKRGEFFLQVWKKSCKDKNTPWAAERPRVVPEKDLAQDKIWYKKKDIFIVSPQRAELQGFFCPTNHIFWDTKDRFPAAADLAYLGYEKFSKQGGGDKVLHPFYLRKTDAEILFKGKSKPVFRWERAGTAVSSRRVSSRTRMAYKEKWI